MTATSHISSPPFRTTPPSAQGLHAFVRANDLLLSIATSLHQIFPRFAFLKRSHHKHTRSRRTWTDTDRHIQKQTATDGRTDLKQTSERQCGAKQLAPSDSQVTSDQDFVSFQPIFGHPHTQTRITLFRGVRISMPNWKPSPNRTSIGFSQIAFPITVLAKDDHTDSVQEERLGLPYWTMIQAICAVVDESKFLDSPIWNYQ